jgi:transcription elongation factor
MPRCAALDHPGFPFGNGGGGRGGWGGGAGRRGGAAGRRGAGAARRGGAGAPAWGGAAAPATRKLNNFHEARVIRDIERPKGSRDAEAG